MKIDLNMIKLEQKERIQCLTNKELYEEAFDMASGDGYDGCFTPVGIIVFDMLKEELNTRLKEWLNGKYDC